MVLVLKPLVLQSLLPRHLQRPLLLNPRKVSRSFSRSFSFFRASAGYMPSFLFFCGFYAMCPNKLQAERHWPLRTTMLHRGPQRLEFVGADDAIMSDAELDPDFPGQYIILYLLLGRENGIPDLLFLVVCCMTGCPQCRTMLSMVPNLVLLYSSCCGRKLYGFSSLGISFGVCLISLVLYRCEDCINRLFSKAASVVCSVCGKAGLTKKSFVAENLDRQVYQSELKVRQKLAPLYVEPLCFAHSLLSFLLSICCLFLPHLSMKCCFEAGRF